MRPAEPFPVNPFHSNLTPARHWKDIPQEVSHRAMSSEGRRRVLMGAAKSILVAAGVGILAWGGYVVVAGLQENAGKPVAGSAPTTPLQDLVLVTDGALDQAWLARTLAVPKGASLMSLDLYELRGRLLASPQVRAATLTRVFPATLNVTLSERMPVARLQVQEASGEPQTMYVARDGVVYGGVGYDPKMTETLPWLAGVTLTRQGGVFLPVAGMAPVADLLAKTHLETEHLDVTWRSLSLARLESDGEIEVTTKDGLKITFGRNDDYFRQLANLDAILDTVRSHPEKAVRVINLAISGGVPVAFDAAPAANEPMPESAPAATSTPPPLFTGFHHH